MPLVCANLKVTINLLTFKFAKMSVIDIYIYLLTSYDSNLQISSKHENTVTQCAFLQDLFHFLRFSMFFLRFPELFKDISASVDQQIMKI